MIVYQTPSQIVFQNRRLFHVMQKALDESASDWFKRLQKFIESCEFDHVSDYMLIDKFISGLGDSDFEKISQLPSWTLEELVLVVLGNAHIFNAKETKRCSQLLENTRSQDYVETPKNQFSNETNDNETADVQIKTELTPVDLDDSYFIESNEDVNSEQIEPDGGSQNSSTLQYEKARLTKSERDKRYVAKLKESGNYDDYKKAKARNAKIRRKRVKTKELYLPPEIQLHLVEKRRRAGRERMKRYRDRKQQKGTELRVIEKIEPIESFDVDETIESVLTVEPSIVWIDPKQFDEEETNSSPKTRSQKRKSQPKSKSSPKPIPEFTPKKTYYVRKRTFQCYICSLDCSKLYELKTHLSLFHPPKVEERTVFECPHCPKTTISRIMLSRHLNKYHGELRLHKCPCCSEEFAKRGQLDKHIPQNHPEYRPFVCEHCANSFKTNSELKRHYQRHTGQKNFKCDICDMLLASSSSFKAHMLIHTGDKPYECKECGKTFRQASSLRKHMISIHNPEQKPSLCATCGKRFNSIYHLRLHIYSHTGEKPYRCDICGSNFSQPSTLKWHIRRVHEKQPKTAQTQIN